MIITKINIRTLGSKALRINDTIEFVQIRTTVVARPRARPFTSVVVIANSGQIPSNWIRAGFLLQSPSAIRVLISLITVFGRQSDGA